MTTMNISLPEDMKAMIELRVRSGMYSNASDYVRDLVRDDLGDHETWVLDPQTADAIDRGEASGMSARSVKQIIDEEFSKFRST